MIVNSEQSWEVGDMVVIGFLKNLMIVKIEPTPGDYMPDAYILVSRKGVNYRFVPHNGITRIS